MAARRRRVGFAVLAACGIVLAAALLVGRGDDVTPAYLGDQSDAASVGAAVDAAIGDGSRGGLSTESSTACAPQTRDSYGQGLGPLVYTATLRWQGVPAVALAYRVAGDQGGGLDHRVFVMSRSDCQLLMAQSL